MRIAVTGTHGSGKTTLIEDFLDRQSDYAHEQEPYWALAQQGVAFADGPTIADLEEQLRYSCAMIVERATDERVIFDRSPIDFLAYLDVVGEQEGAPWEPSGKLMGQIEKAMRVLDLLVFLPLSSPDEIAAGIEYPRLRRGRPSAQNAVTGGRTRLIRSRQAAPARNRRNAKAAAGAAGSGG